MVFYSENDLHSYNIFSLLYALGLDPELVMYDKFIIDREIGTVSLEEIAD